MISKVETHMKKTALFAFLSVLIVSFVHSQSLVELSKREKARREGLKGKNAVVVTNEDLAKVKKKPAVEVVLPEPPMEESAVEGEEFATEEEIPSETQEEALTDEETTEEATPQEPAAKIETLPQLPQQTALSEEEFKKKKAEFEDKWNKAAEMVELLTLKMNGLWQEFYSLDDMTARDRIQQQISETYDKLVKAQVDETRAREELDNFIANSKREGVPEIWIK
jgi:hypothetical protein